ncbi:MAG: glycogen synthase GlgA [Clostridiaceae bacterium]|jgi:starch synthase|nr:glycogen synthase GlgA [Clostridiaceae bacterium]
MKILFAVSEAVPFKKTGGLGDVAGALPKELKLLGNDARIIMPLYQDIPQHFRDIMVFKGATFVELAWRKQYCGVFEAAYDGVVYYFIDNEYYFKRSAAYGHFDDGERFAYFARAVLESMRVTGFYPDILHCNDWQTALCPVFLDVFFRSCEDYKKIKTVYTIHNIEFQGKYDRSIAGDVLGLSPAASLLVEYSGNVNYMKGGIESSSVVTTVSGKYAEEILDPFYGYGLSGILRARKYKIRGILNGIDTKINSPERDSALFVNYGYDTLAKKKENKKQLAEMLNLPYAPNKPLIAMVTRFTEQKGMDLVSARIERILEGDLQMVLLGTGDWKYETKIHDLNKRYGKKFCGLVSFNPDLSSKLYGGADIFLMPSKFEPCGLSQMIAMAYGTVPVVRATGGLADTVEPYNPLTKQGVGFTFLTYDADDMLDAVWRAVDAFYNDEKGWKQIQKNGMSKDFGWASSAKEYVKLYESL